MTAPEKDEAREDQEAAEAKPEAAAPEEVEADVIEDDAESEEPEEDPVEAAKAEADAWRDKYFRLHAEWDTYRRRMNVASLMRRAMAKRVCSVASKPFTTRSARC